MAEGEERNPVEQALEVLVFAPLGLVVTARTQLPEMVAKGRAQVEGQLTVARFIGQFAVNQGKAEVEKRFKAYTARAEPALAPAPRPKPRADEPSPTISAPQTLLNEPASPAPAPPAADLAIPGYDALSASQVVQRLAGLSSAELEQVRAYEAATRGRKTVVNKISQLQSSKPQSSKPQTSKPQTSKQQ